jgi:hypothetical protein
MKREQIRIDNEAIRAAQGKTNKGSSIKVGGQIFGFFGLDPEFRGKSESWLEKRKPAPSPTRLLNFYLFSEFARRRPDPGPLA